MRGSRIDEVPRVFIKCLASDICGSSDDRPDQGCLETAVKHTTKCHYGV